MSVSPRQLYRQYLRNLQYVPDPHVWSVLVPEFRSFLKEGKAKHASKAMRHLRAAVACYPHALTRLLKYSYGQGGSVRWGLVKNLTLSSAFPKAVWPHAPRFPPQTLQPVPAPLAPCFKVRPADTPPVRARTVPPRKALQRQARDAWQRAWDSIGAVPLTMPPGSGCRTGWEGRGVAESLHELAGVARPLNQVPMPRRQRGDAPPEVIYRVDTRTLPTFNNLPGSLKAVYPRQRREGHPPDRYPRPRPAHTRANPKTWRPPTVISTRLLTRMYRRIWDELKWVRKTKDGAWVLGQWEECR